jgi:hypothetical protein
MCCSKIRFILNRPFAHFCLDSKIKHFYRNCFPFFFCFNVDSKVPFYEKFNENNIYFPHNLNKILMLEQTCSFSICYKIIL